MKREWLVAAAVLVPISLGVAGCPKKTTPPVNTGPETNRPIGELGPAEAAPAPEPAPVDVAPAPTGHMSTAGGKVYVVQKGDGLMAISRKFYNGDASQYKKIAAANNLQPPYAVKVGQKLVIP